MEDRPDLLRRQPLKGIAPSGQHLTVRVDRLSRGADPLHDSIALSRSIVQSARPGAAAAADLTTEQARLGPRIGFEGRPVPEPHGNLTGLDTGGNGGSCFPSAVLP